MEQDMKFGIVLYCFVLCVKQRCEAWKDRLHAPNAGFNVISSVWSVSRCWDTEVHVPRACSAKCRRYVEQLPASFWKRTPVSSGLPAEPLVTAAAFGRHTALWVERWRSGCRQLWAQTLRLSPGFAAPLKHCKDRRHVQFNLALNDNPEMQSCDLDEDFSKPCAVYKLAVNPEHMSTVTDAYSASISEHSNINI